MYRPAKSSMESVVRHLFSEHNIVGSAADLERFQRDELRRQESR